MTPTAPMSTPLANAIGSLLRSSLEGGTPVTMGVAGRSMLPLLRPGDVIHVEPMAPAEARPGDILVMWRDGGLLTHRLVAVDDYGWHTRGDNSLASDPPVGSSAIMGRVVGVGRQNYRRGTWRHIDRGLGAVTRAAHHATIALRWLPRPSRQLLRWSGTRLHALIRNTLTLLLTFAYPR
jgi:signal peptidase I